MIEVREMKATDITPVIRFCKTAHQESQWAWVPFSAAALRRSIRQMMRKPDYVALAAFEEGKVVGFLFGTVGQVIYGRALWATDIEFVAHKGGKELLEAFREWAISVGATVRLHGTSNPEPTEGRERAKDRWMRMQRLERIGGMYQERLK